MEPTKSQSEKNQQKEVADFLALPPSGQFNSLCADICDQIILFIGIDGRHGVNHNAAGVNRRMRASVLSCPLWYRAYVERFPLSYRIKMTHEQPPKEGAEQEFWRSGYIAAYSQKYLSSSSSKDPSATATAPTGVKGFFTGVLNAGKSLLAKNKGKGHRVLTLGLDAAGKSLLLYNHMVRPAPNAPPPPPTIGFNVEDIQRGKSKFVVWDVGGQPAIRPLWRHYYDDTEALIFVVDSNARSRMDEARQTLDSIFDNKGMMQVPLLVYANYQDMPNAMSPEEVGVALGFDNFDPGKVWCIRGSSATGSGEGVNEGLEWLGAQELKSYSKVEKVVQSFPKFM